MNNNDWQNAVESLILLGVASSAKYHHLDNMAAALFTILETDLIPGVPGTIFLQKKRISYEVFDLVIAMWDAYKQKHEVKKPPRKRTRYENPYVKWLLEDNIWE